jgi:hypothetical protein
MQYTLYIKRDGNILDTQKITSDRIPQNGRRSSIVFQLKSRFVRVVVVLCMK